MSIFSFRVFKTPKHQQFDYVPRHWDRNKEELENRVNRRKPLKKGDFAIVLPKEKHCYKNASTDNSFVMICAVPKEYE